MHTYAGMHFTALCTKHLEVGSPGWNKSISVNKEEKRMGICESLMSWSPVDAVASLININK